MKLSSENTSTSIYLQQIQNEIDLGEGYSKIRQYLFKELLSADGSNAFSDDRLAEVIVIKLTNNLNENLHQSQKIDRTIKIIEDLLTYAEDVMTPAMHNQLFVSALVNIAVPKLVTFNAKLDEYSRMRALGLFMFWFDTYAREEKGDYNLFLTAYKMLKDRKLGFPSGHTVKPNDSVKKQIQAQKTPIDHTTQVILEDIQQFTKKTQILLKQSAKQVVNTEYVRLIKHKSKILYDFTQKGSSLNEKQKNIVKDLYKRLRTVLKQVDKLNQTKLQTKNSIKQEQAYVQQKMTPKKIEQKTQSPIKANNQSTSNKKYQENTEIQAVDLKISKPFSKHSSSQQKPKLNQVYTIDLLDMITQAKPKTESSQKRYVSLKLSTPEKKQVYRENNNVDLLGQKVQNQIQEPNDQQQFVEGTLVQSENPNIAKSPQKQQQQKISKALFEVFSTPKKCKSIQEQQDGLAKNSSKKSETQSVQLQNEQNKKNKYSFIPNDLNLTPTSSNEDSQSPKKQGFGFNLFSLFGAKKQGQKSQDLYDQTKPYDYIPQYLKNKVQSETENKSAPLQSLKLQADDFYTFKPVKPIEYAQNVLQRSPSEHDEEDHFHQKTEFQHLQEVNIQSPGAKDKEGKKLIQNED